jgi:hypothetical protein
VTINSSISINSTIQATQQLVASNLGGEVVILNLKDGTYYSLDDVGVVVWDILQQPCSIWQLCMAVMEQYEVDSAQCTEDILALLEDMLSVGLIEVQHVATESVSAPAAR